MRMALPQDVLWILQRFEAAGLRAYAVGGCVRDTLLGLPPKDWDLCTAAKPEAVLRLFRDQHVIETGLKHGTVTLMLHHQPYEITTFRVDGAYTDHRHPDQVQFVEDIQGDLSRRDFTINAMAYHPDAGLIDLFGGQSDLRSGLIRCVGDPATRFEEDALRILRALRFASVYGFRLDDDTARAAHLLAPTLHRVAMERVRVELCKLLCGRDAAILLTDHAAILFELFPELRPMQGFDQRNPHHRYDVWTHTVRVIDACPATEVLRLSALLHDSGKPSAFTVDAQGIGHFNGHPKLSADIAGAVLRRLKADTATLNAVTMLVLRHDEELRPERRLMRRRLNQLGVERLRQLIQLHRADRIGTGTCTMPDIDAETDALTATLDQLIAENAAFSLRQLDIDGRALIALGYRGRAIGQELESLLDRVIGEEIGNTKKELLAAAEADYVENR